jgi:hypothetical protein
VCSKPLKTWKVACPCCGGKESITLDLNDLTLIDCSECNDTFTPQTAVKMAADQLRRWQAVATWIRMAGATLDAMSDEAAEEYPAEPETKPESIGL